MLDRIQELLRVRELSSSQFADAIGVSRPVVSHILSGRNKPSLEVVQKIIAAFPDLALNWLLNGAGPMLERPAATDASKANITSGPAARPASEPAVAPVAPETPVASVAPVVALGDARAVALPPVPATEPVAAPEAASQPASAAPAPVTASATTPAGANLAYALAEPGKSIRRIVLFYQDGTFTDFRPETEA